MLLYKFLHFKSTLVLSLSLYYIYMFFCFVFLHHRGALRIVLFALRAMTIKAILLYSTTFLVLAWDST